VGIAFRFWLLDKVMWKVSAGFFHGFLLQTGSWLAQEVQSPTPQLGSLLTVSTVDSLTAKTSPRVATACEHTLSLTSPSCPSSYVQWIRLSAPYTKTMYALCLWHGRAAAQNCIGGSILGDEDGRLRGEA
jgi:hypothetical protein